MFSIKWTDNTIAENKCSKKLRIEQHIPQLNRGFKETRKDSSSCPLMVTVLGSNWDNSLSVNDECKVIIIPHVDLWSRAVKKNISNQIFSSYGIIGTIFFKRSIELWVNVMNWMITYIITSKQTIVAIWHRDFSLIVENWSFLNRSSQIIQVYAR